jgi:hypothetical protein
MCEITKPKHENKSVDGENGGCYGKDKSQFFGIVDK